MASTVVHNSDPLDGDKPDQGSSPNFVSEQLVINV